MIDVAVQPWWMEELDVLPPQSGRFPAGRRPSPQLVCPIHGEALVLIDAELSCPAGCRHPVIDGIPRFVESESYSGSFGLQWRKFRKTQLDSHTGTGISRSRLERCLGGSLDPVRGASVLEVGCGAGRFTEVLVAAGARVFACDLSTAVEANLDNIGPSPGYFVCQADVERLPFPEGAFDVVLCIGVVQHTRDPERTIRTLCSRAAPGGGLVVFDHYAPGYPMSGSRRMLRRLLLGLPPPVALTAVRALVSCLWPAHRALCRLSGRVPGAGRAYNALARISPVVDYQRSYPELSPEHQRAWATLDTHDALTDRYKHLRSEAEIAAALTDCGMVNIEVAAGGNGVEARARRPRDGRGG